MIAKAFSPRDMQSLAQWVVDNGDPQDSERGKTWEILAMPLVLGNPLNRLDAHRYRKLNFPFAIAEWLGMLSGIDFLPFYTKFIPSYKEFSSDGEHVDGAYGPRLQYPSLGYSAIDQVIRTLKMTPESRRAVVAIYNNDDLIGAGGLNTPCTLSMQFLVREKKLEMVTMMRSNDVHFGLTNDVVVFTLTQEYVATQLGLQMGSYHHFASSLHVYERLMDKFEEKRLASEEGRWPHTMGTMPKNFDNDELRRLTSAYSYLVSDLAPETVDGLARTLKTEYAQDLFYAAAVVVFRNMKSGVAEMSYAKIDDPTIKRISGFWLKTEE